MEGQSSHASVNPNTSANTSSDAGTGIKSMSRDMAWEWRVWKDPTKKEIFGVHFVARKRLEGSQVGLPFNTVRDKSFQDMIYAIGEYGRAHCVNLMIGDIGEKIPKIKSALSDARAVMVLFVSEQWTKSDFVKKAVGKRVERIVAKQEFWDNVYLACQVLAPLVDLVRLVDTEEKPCMGYIYDAMSRAKEQISKNLKVIFPCISLCCILIRLVPDPDENDSVREELNMYIDSGGQFGSDSAKWTRTKFAPYIWWRSYGSFHNLLQRFAITVLSQTCSASPCERNWSAFDNLHSKKRNCLCNKKLNDLVFIQYKTRLRRRFESIKTNKSLDPILLRDVEENDEWTIPTENELQDFVNAGDDLLWSDVREAMGGNVDIEPSTRSKRVRFETDDDEISVGGGLEEEVNALDDLDSDAEPLDCN
ncbi:hypothetical protein Tco_0791128 [Tanacetum coccineum]